MQVLINPRFLGALAALVGVIASLLWPGTSEETVVRLVTNGLVFLGALYQPPPGKNIATVQPVPPVEAPKSVKYSRDIGDLK